MESQISMQTTRMGNTNIVDETNGVDSDTKRRNYVNEEEEQQQDVEDQRSLISALSQEYEGDGDDDDDDDADDEQEFDVLGGEGIETTTLGGATASTNNTGESSDGGYYFNRPPFFQNHHHHYHHRHSHSLDYSTSTTSTTNSKSRLASLLEGDDAAAGDCDHQQNISSSLYPSLDLDSARRTFSQYQQGHHHHPIRSKLFKKQQRRRQKRKREQQEAPPAILTQKIIAGTTPPIRSTSSSNTSSGYNNYFPSSYQNNNLNGTDQIRNKKSSNVYQPRAQQPKLLLRSNNDELTNTDENWNNTLRCMLSPRVLVTAIVFGVIVFNLLPLGLKHHKNHHSTMSNAAFVKAESIGDGDVYDGIFGSFGFGGGSSAENESKKIKGGVRG